MLLLTRALSLCHRTCHLWHLLYVPRTEKSSHVELHTVRYHSVLMWREWPPRLPLTYFLQDHLRAGGSETPCQGRANSMAALEGNPFPLCAYLPAKDMVAFDHPAGAEGDTNEISQPLSLTPYPSPPSSPFHYQNLIFFWADVAIGFVIIHTQKKHFQW